MEKRDIAKELSTNSYPGRGIIIGKSADGKSAVTAYFIMGRSVNSRNRVFVEEGQGIRTQAFDPSKMKDPSLIIYAPVRVLGDVTIVANGDQSDTIYDFMSEGKTFEDALRSCSFEPDGPIFTPRISGIVKPNGDYRLSILKSADGDPSCNHRFFYEYDAPIAGTGHFIHTYQENLDPLPSFEGEPRKVIINAPDAQSWAQEIWTNLNADHKVSLFVQYIDLATGERDTVIINKHLED